MWPTTPVGEHCRGGALGNFHHGLCPFVFGRGSAQPGAIVTREASSSSPDNQTGHAGSINTAAIHVWLGKFKE